MAMIRRILGKRGRTTIPYEFRQILDMRYNDVLTFAINDDHNCVVITKEKICDDCVKNIKRPDEIPIMSILEHLTRDEKLQVTSALFAMLMTDKDGGNDAT
ncbi:hypothetical protein SAMN05216413_2603 [Ruminococcaceae bacterium KH2T8]|nr:hypothetical protein SAMN05216413_2603 [Ruminococcaceae bacterium KH2T8]